MLLFNKCNAVVVSSMENNSHMCIHLCFKVTHICFPKFTKLSCTFSQVKYV